MFWNQFLKDYMATKQCWKLLLCEAAQSSYWTPPKSISSYLLLMPAILISDSALLFISYSFLYFVQLNDYLPCFWNLCSSVVKSCIYLRYYRLHINIVFLSLAVAQ